MQSLSDGESEVAVLLADVSQHPARRNRHNDDDGNKEDASLSIVSRYSFRLAEGHF